MIEIKHLRKSYGDRQIYEDLSLKIETGDLVGIMGPSGSGKTTFLNLLAGLQSPDGGEIIGIDKNRISCVFQEDRLLPWCTVRENIQFAAPASDQKINEILSMVGLEDVSKAYPATLSGGMRQRVSIARAFCYPSDLLLMDEPFSSLDQAMKMQLIEALKVLLERDPKTVIWVSHDEELLKSFCHKIYALKGRPVVFEEVRGYCDA